MNGGDCISDYYYCRYIGLEVGDGSKECLLDKFEKELKQGGAMVCKKDGLEKRVAEIYKDNKWVEIPFRNLKEGNKFRLFNLDGSSVVDEKGRSRWIATCDAYFKLDNWMINIY